MIASTVAEVLEAVATFGITYHILKHFVHLLHPLSAGEGRRSSSSKRFRKPQFSTTCQSSFNSTPRRYRATPEQQSQHLVLDRRLGDFRGCSRKKSLSQSFLQNSGHVAETSHCSWDFSSEGKSLDIQGLRKSQRQRTLPRSITMSTLRKNPIFQ